MTSDNESLPPAQSQGGSGPFTTIAVCVQGYVGFHGIPYNFTAGSIVGFYGIKTAHHGVTWRLRAAIGTYP